MENSFPKSGMEFVFSGLRANWNTREKGGCIKVFQNFRKYFIPEELSI